MKRFLVLLVLLVFLISLPGFAADRCYVKDSARKAKEGAINIFTGWLELPFQTTKGYKKGWENNKLLGGIFGLFRGFAHGIGRTVDGVYQFVTFPLPNPKNNDGVGLPLDSKYAWEDGVHYSLLKDGLRDGLRPMKRKIFRGTINACFGILDMPGQLGKGLSEDKPFKGLAKAFVFPMGRIASGLYDVATFPFPNEIAQYGYPLEEKQPWDALQPENRRNDL